MNNIAVGDNEIFVIAMMYLIIMIITMLCKILIKHCDAYKFYHCTIYLYLLYSYIGGSQFYEKFQTFVSTVPT